MRLLPVLVEIILLTYRLFKLGSMGQSNVSAVNGPFFVAIEALRKVSRFRFFNKLKTA